MKLFLGLIAACAFFNSCAPTSHFGEHYKPIKLGHKSTDYAAMKVVDLASFNSEYNKICKNGWTAIGTSSFTGELTDFEYARNLAMNCGGSLVLVARKFADTETRYEAVPVATTSGSTVTVDDNTRGNIYGNYGSYSGTYSESSTRNVHISGETIYAHKPYNVKLYDHVSAFFVKE